MKRVVLVVLVQVWTINLQISLKPDKLAGQTNLSHHVILNLSISLKHHQFV